MPRKRKGSVRSKQLAKREKERARRLRQKKKFGELCQCLMEPGPLFEESDPGAEQPVPFTKKSLIAMDHHLPHGGLPALLTDVQGFPLSSDLPQQGVCIPLRIPSQEDGAGQIDRKNGYSSELLNKKVTVIQNNMRSELLNRSFDYFSVSNEKPRMLNMLQPEYQQPSMSEMNCIDSNELSVDAVSCGVLAEREVESVHGVCTAETVTDFVSKCIQGSFCQGNVNLFSTSSGKQCVANCLSAVIYSKFKGVSKWTSQDLDSILMQGNHLYTSLRKCTHIRHEYLLISELPVEGLMHGSIYKNVFEQPVAGLLIGDRTIAGSTQFPNFHVALSNTLKVTSACFATFCGNTVAIITGEKALYLFDPHSRDCLGMISEQGTSVLVQFEDIFCLVKHCQKLAGCMSTNQDVQYEITGIKSEVKHCSCHHSVAQSSDVQSSGPLTESERVEIRRLKNRLAQQKYRKKNLEQARFKNRLRQRKYQQEKLEQVRLPNCLRRQKYRKENLERVRLYDRLYKRRYRRENHEQVRLYDRLNKRRYRKENHEQVRLYDRLNKRRYRKENHEQVCLSDRLNKRRYRKENHEQVSLSDRLNKWRYRKENPEKNRLQSGLCMRRTREKNHEKSVFTDCKQKRKTIKGPEDIATVVLCSQKKKQTKDDTNNKDRSLITKFEKISGICFKDVKVSLGEVKPLAASDFADIDECVAKKQKIEPVKLKQDHVDGPNSLKDVSEKEPLSKKTLNKVGDHKCGHNKVDAVKSIAYKKDDKIVERPNQSDRCPENARSLSILPTNRPNCQVFPGSICATKQPINVKTVKEILSKKTSNKVGDCSLDHKSGYNEVDAVRSIAYKKDDNIVDSLNHSDRSPENARSLSILPTNRPKWQVFPGTSTCAPSYLEIKKIPSAPTMCKQSPYVQVVQSQMEKNSCEAGDSDHQDKNLEPKETVPIDSSCILNEISEVLQRMKKDHGVVDELVTVKEEPLDDSVASVQNQNTVVQSEQALLTNVKEETEDVKNMKDIKQEPLSGEIQKIFS